MIVAAPVNETGLRVCASSKAGPGSVLLQTRSFGVGGGVRGVALPLRLWDLDCFWARSDDWCQAVPLTRAFLMREWESRRGPVRDETHLREWASLPL